MPKWLDEDAGGAAWISLHILFTSLNVIDYLWTKANIPHSHFLPLVKTYFEKKTSSLIVLKRGETWFTWIDLGLGRESSVPKI